MKRLFVLLLKSTMLVMFMQNITLSATTGDYRSTQSGKWGSASNWQRYNGSTWVNATLVPDADNANVITIQSGHRITFTSSLAFFVDQVIVNGELEISDGSTLTLDYSTTYDLDVYGTLSIASSGGEVNQINGAKAAFRSGSAYKHLYNGGSIPLADWFENSLCEITGLTNTNLFPNSTEQQFWNVTWDCPFQLHYQNVWFTRIKGNLTIKSGGIMLHLFSNPRYLTIDGDLILYGGAVDLGDDSYYIEQLTLKGRLYIANAQALKRTYTTNNTEIIFGKAGTQTCYLNADYSIEGSHINYTIGSTSTFQLETGSANLSVSSGRTLTLNGTLDCNGHYITGAGNFVSNAGSTLVLRDDGGITTSGEDGEIQVTGTRTFSPSANYLFTGPYILQGGNALTNAANISLDHSMSGFIYLNTDLTVTGSINLTNGYLDIRMYTLTLGPSAVLNETATNYLTATTGKIITTRNINNVTSQNIAGMGLILTTAANLGSTTIERHHNAVTACYSTGIKRWYKITPTNNSSLNATVVFSYQVYELNGLDEIHLRLFKSTDFTGWQIIGSTLNTTDNTLTSSGINSLAYFTVSDVNHPLVYSANLKVFLQGPYSAGTMSNTLNLSGLIPLTQPYNTSPWNYSGTESVGSIPADVVDWVLVELRTGTAAGTKIASRAGFLKTDGTIVEVDGMSKLGFPGARGTYYVVVRHRNHLAIMSSLDNALVSANSELYDFTTAQTQAYGTNPMKDFGDGAFGMIAGDVNCDCSVKYNLSGNDRVAIYSKIGGSNVNASISGYYSEDINMDGTVKYNLGGNDRVLLYQSIGGSNVNTCLTSQIPN